ncbi:MAG: 30S ribosome-binding factor RbfA [Microthrixaceae bacterium]|nr:30S ribosome-binding factor RbfA [Microthrixaceae bacterium]MCO5318478.1 30S ribosome-binding factor RbfA [Microthrixaceae bacterium]
MARGRNPKPFKRTDRISELVREIVASELERIGDERTELVTVTSVRVDRSLERAEVYYSALSADEEGRGEEVAEALEELRWPVQQVVNRQVRARRTPQIRFHPDDVLSEAMRIDDLLAGLSGGETAPGDSDDVTGTDQ